jgi:hypothetical protein
LLSIYHNGDKAKDEKEEYLIHKSILKKDDPGKLA